MRHRFVRCDDPFAIVEQVVYSGYSDHKACVEKRLGRRLHGDNEWLRLYYEQLNDCDKQTFLEMLERMVHERRGPVPIEYAAQRAKHELNLAITLEPLVPFEREETQSNKFLIRCSDMTYNCAIDVYFHRSGLLLPTTEAEKKMKEGTMCHALTLTDPPFGDDFFDYYLLDGHPKPRRLYCERSMFFTLDKVCMEGTPDAVFHLSNSFNKVVIFEMKSGASPPLEAHRRYKRQVAAYAIGLKKAYNVDAVLGIIPYFKKKFSRGWVMQEFEIDDKLKEETLRFIEEIAIYVPLFEDGRKEEAHAYKYLSEKRGRCKSCSYEDLCKQTIDAIKT